MQTNKLMLTAADGVELIKLLGAHMACETERLRLERKYPDWDDEGAKAFDELSIKHYEPLVSIANLLAKYSHSVEYAALTSQFESDAAERLRIYNASRASA